jgi:hypothetical protein
MKADILDVDGGDIQRVVIVYGRRRGRVSVVEVVVGWLFPGSGDDCRLVWATGWAELMTKVRLYLIL